MSNKGFTLVEALLIVSVLAILLACFPFFQISDSLKLQYSTETLQQYLMYAQSTSLIRKERTPILIHNDTIEIASNVYKLENGIQCDETAFHFTPTGNISKALTITCRLHQEKKKIILELGAGRIYVQ